MEQTHDTQQIIKMLEYMDEKAGPERGFLHTISQAPQKFTLPMLMGMGWFFLALAVSPFIIVALVNPLLYMRVDTVPVVHYSFQIPMVILVSAVLGRKFGTMLMGLYLLLGLAGLPLFSNGGGWHYLFEASSGYLLGFALVPFAIHRLLRHGLRGGKEGWFQGRSVFLVMAAVAGVLTIHLAGLVGLTIHWIGHQINWVEFRQWVYILTLSKITYDLLFAVIALTMVRIVRLLFSLALY